MHSIFNTNWSRYLMNMVYSVTASLSRLGLRSTNDNALPQLRTKFCASMCLHYTLVLQRQMHCPRTSVLRHTRRTSKARGKLIYPIVFNVRWLLVASFISIDLFHFTSFIEKKQWANWPLTCQRKCLIKMIKQMQMARYKLTSYILYT